MEDTNSDTADQQLWNQPTVASVKFIFGVWLQFYSCFVSDVYRTNSDSALHQSAMNPKPQEVFAGGSQELQPKRGNGSLTLKGLKAFLFFH